MIFQSKLGQNGHPTLVSCESSKHRIGVQNLFAGSKDPPSEIGGAPWIILRKTAMSKRHRF